MSKKYIDIEVFDGDDDIKYVRHEDMLNLLEQIRIKQEEKDKEIERLKNIIKEIREYIEKEKAKLPLGRNDFTCEMVYSDEVVLANELLEILDKGSDEISK